jgi:hypothetical protein
VIARTIHVRTDSPAPQRDDGAHQCPVPGCRIVLPRTKLMCLAHWRKVPTGYRNAVHAAWDHGNGMGTEALRQAQDAALAALERKLARDG